MAVVAAPPPPPWLEHLGEEVPGARCQVYLLSFSRLLPDTLASSNGQLRSLDGLTKDELVDFVRDAFENPENAVAGRPRQREGPLVRKVVVVSETHADGSIHFHGAVLLFVPCRWPAVKRALRVRYQLAANFSCTHREFWSALRYLVFATTRKLEVDADRVVWLAAGETFDAFKESQEPYNAKAWRAKREKRDMASSAEGSAAVFTDLDFKSLVLSEGLTTRAKVLRYVQDAGIDAMRLFVSRSQRRLDELLAHAKEWGDARKVAAEEELTDWALLCRTADVACPDGDDCPYSRCAEAILEGNKHNWDRRCLAAVLRTIIVSGPSKETRVPFLIGATNTGKSTLVESFDELYGFERVFHLPAVKDAKYGLRNWLRDKRFVFWDECSPVELATNDVLSVTTFKAAFGGKWFEIQRAQSHHDGNQDFRWQRGAVFTNKAKGLWTPTEAVSAEDIQHLQSRVECFAFTHKVVPPGGRPKTTPQCACHMSRWIRDGASAYDAMQLVQPPQAWTAQADRSAVADGSVTDLESFLDAASLPSSAREALAREVVATGAVNVQELTRQDWEKLEAWQLLKPLERRRVFKHVPPDLL